jgi:hypothetical protein
LPEKTFQFLPLLVPLSEIVDDIDCADNEVQCDECFLIVYWDPCCFGLEKLHQTFSHLICQKFNQRSSCLLDNAVPVADAGLLCLHDYFIGKAFEVFFVFFYQFENLWFGLFVDVPLILAEHSAISSVLDCLGCDFT